MELADTVLQFIPYNPLPRYLTEYQPGITPLSDTTPIVATLIAYFLSIFSIRWFMQDKAPLNLTSFFQFHNLFLTAISGLLLVLIAEEILPIWWRTGFFSAICRSWTERLEFYYIINYYIKYVELVDTVFLAWKKKPLTFLHVYHHSATTLFCYTQLNGKPPASWVLVILNLMVHVPMYYYYYATAGGAKIWWKKYLTSSQITQFVIDLVLLYFAFWQRLVHRGRVPAWGYVGYCSGSETADYVALGLLTSYLFLFIDFYIRTYKGPLAKTSKANGKANVKKME